MVLLAQRTVVRMVYWVFSGGGLRCANCGTYKTPLWRRDDQGNNVSNGIYYELHGTYSFESVKETVKRK